MELIVNPGCTVKTSRTAVELAARFAHVYAAVGIHPENCHDFTPAQIDDLRALAARPKVVAIGEIGLDYYWAENPPRELQQDVLRRQMALAPGAVPPGYHPRPRRPRRHDGHRSRVPAGDGRVPLLCGLC